MERFPITKILFGLCLVQQSSGAIASTAEDAYFERELTLSAIEQVDQRAWHQDFLYGFELDRSADTALFIENVPINQPMNGQGQGYKNTSFIIPELIAETAYKKGPFYSDEGDFSSGGTIRMQYADTLEADTLALEAGGDAYQRALLTGSIKMADGSLVYGLETVGQDVNPDLSNSSSANGHHNAVFKYHQGDLLQGFNITTMLHQSDWTSDSVQTALGRTPEQQLLLANAADDSSRYSLSANWWHASSRHRNRVSAYWVDYDASLNIAFRFYNNTGQLAERTVTSVDKRIITGVRADHDWFDSSSGFHRLGAELRRDAVVDVAASDITTEQRSTGDAELNASALYYRHQYQWSDRVRTVAGLRWDHLELDAEDALETDFNQDSDLHLSPKLSLIMGPWKSTEYFINMGLGIHSNDARYSYRGINSRQRDRSEVELVSPLAQTRGADIGFTTQRFNNSVISLALWYLDADSELVTGADGGQLRPSRRKGLELGIYYQPMAYLSFDFNMVTSSARFSDAQPRGNHIPGSTEDTARVGISYLNDRWAGTLSARYFGESPYTEDNSLRTKAVTGIDMSVKYQYSPRLLVRLELLNLLDKSDHDDAVLFIDRLAAAEAFVQDFYYQPVPPRTVRLQLSYSWQHKL